MNGGVLGNTSPAHNFSMAALVPYVPNKYVLAKRAIQYAPMVYRAAKRAKVDRVAMKAVKRIQRKWRKSRSKASKRSAPPANRTARMNDTVVVNQNIPYASLLIRAIKFDTMQANLGRRDQLNVFVKGFSICQTFWNRTDQNRLGTMEVHWALCQLNCPLENPPDGGAGPMGEAIRTVIRPTFFRDGQKENTFTSGENARAIPFVDTPGVYPFEYLCQPLNKDKFHVITHKRFRLSTKSEQTVATGTWVKKMRKYFKINKWVSFNNENDIFGKKPFFVAIWYVHLDPEDYPADPTVQTPLVAHNYKDSTFMAA